MRLVLLLTAAAVTAFAQGDPYIKEGPVLINPTPQAQTPIGKGSISGHVVDSKSHQPVKKAHVTLNGMAQLNAVTDSSGSFAFRALPAGGYFLMANHEEYSTNPMDTSQNLTLNDGEEKSDVEIRLRPGASISGQVLDEDESPVARCLVRAVRSQHAEGRMRMMGSFGSDTDDLGRYRIHGLMPGRYELRAQCGETFPAPHGFMLRNDPNIPREGYARASHAGGVRLEAGAELAGMDFRVKRVRLYMIRGSMSGAPAEIMRQSQVFLESHDNPGADEETIPGYYNFSTGEVTFRAIPAGSYRVVAIVADQQRAYEATQDVEVGKTQVTPVDLKLMPGPTISGSIDVDDPNQRIEGLQIALQPLSQNYRGPFPMAPIAKDGTFEFKMVLPGTFRINGLPFGYLKTVTLGGREISPYQFDISLETAGRLHISASTKMSRIQVTLDPAPKIGDFVTGLLVPETGGSPFVSGMQVGASGQPGMEFTVPPGKYRAMVVAGQNFGLMNEPEVLKALESRSAAVEVQEGGDGKVTVALVPAEDVQKASEADE